MQHSKFAKAAAWVALLAIVLSIVAVVVAPFLMSPDQAASVAAAANQ